MIRLIQTLFAVACIFLIAGFHFNETLLKALGIIAMILSWGLVGAAISILKRNYRYAGINRQHFNL